MPRVLINAHRNIAIEISRKDKWTIIVTGWTPTHRERLLNTEIDREWDTYNYPLHAAIQRFLSPTLPSSFIDETAQRDLKEILKHAG
jgi:hypothetical protein